MEQIPIVDLSEFLDGGRCADQCAQVAAALEQVGALAVRDPRVSEAMNDAFLDMMERYFEQPETDKGKDARPELHYQVGYTPPYLERPRDHRSVVNGIAPDERPEIPFGADAKGRFYWRVGEVPRNTRFPVLNAPNVVPAGFAEWQRTMDEWGRHMLAATTTVAEMAARGFGMPKDEFTSRMVHAPHLLDPTGVDLGAHDQIGTICAGFHYDLNFLSVHGRPRFAGLDLWTRDNRRVPADVPAGHLLVQAGKQMEYLTGGRVLSGFHQVVVNHRTLEDVRRAREAGRSTWRISSTFFAHIASDLYLQPLTRPCDEVARDLYPPKLAGELVEEELRAIGLA